MKIHFLNHSSVLFEYGRVKLLTDPWYFDTCFEGGWGLRYQNPAALDVAVQANYLWISHFHADHFHLPPAPPRTSWPTAARSESGG